MTDRPNGPDNAPGPDRPRETDRIPVTAGLCARCLRARRIVSGRGSVFVLCERSADDVAFPRYPHLPVRACAGFEAGRD